MIVTMTIVAGLATVIQMALQAMVLLVMARAQAMAMVVLLVMAQAQAMVVVLLVMAQRQAMVVLPYTVHRQPVPMKQKSCN